MIIYEKNDKIKSSKQAGIIFKGILDIRNDEDKHKECFYVMILNSLNTILAVDLVAMGTVNRAIVEIRECVKLAIMKNAVSIIVCHNHPSGENTPSQNDKQFISELNKACKLLSISLLDSLIIGKDIFSFADNGIL